MAKQSKSNGVQADFVKAVWTMAAASALGIVVNVYSQKPLAILAEPEADKPVPLKMSVAEYIQALKGNQSVILMDVRGQVEYDAEHAPSALHVPLNELASRYQLIAPNLQGAATIVTMCDSEECDKAEQAAGFLIKLGYKNIRVLQGGWEAYRQSELPRVGGKL